MFLPTIKIHRNTHPNGDTMNILSSGCAAKRNRLLIAALVISGALTARAAQANMQDDINTCNDEVAVIMQQERESRAVSTGVRVATGLIGALIGHGNAEAAAGRAVRNSGYALSSGVNSDATRQKMYMNQCMRKQQAAARKAGR